MTLQMRTTQGEPDGRTEVLRQAIPGEAEVKGDKALAPQAAEPDRPYVLALAHDEPGHSSRRGCLPNLDTDLHGREYSRFDRVGAGNARLYLRYDRARHSGFRQHWALRPVLVSLGA